MALRSGRKTGNVTFGGCRTLTYPLCARSVASPQIVDNSIITNDLHPSVRAKLDAVGTGEQGPAGPAGPKGDTGPAGAQGAPGLSELEADGPYPGSTKLQDFPGNGSNSTAKVPGDEGAAAHTVWVKCAEGKVALGGGFTLAADASLAAKKAVQVVSSEAIGEAIEGDAAGSVLPIGWQVEVINNSASDVTVRPWVTCAKVAK